MKRTRKGFTLLEMVVVVIILGILATIGSVTYGHAIAGSKVATLTESARSVAHNAEAIAANAGTTPASEMPIAESEASHLTIQPGSSSGNAFIITSVLVGNSVCMVLPTSPVDQEQITAIPNASSEC